MSEQFENNIRKKLQEADIPFDPAAWDQMAKRLDDPRRRRPAAWWWAGGLLLFLGVGSWWWFTGENNVDKPATNRITVTDSTSTIGEKQADVDKSTTAKGLGNATPAAPESGSGKAAETGNTGGPVRNNTRTAVDNVKKITRQITADPAHTTDRPLAVDNPSAKGTPAANNTTPGDQNKGTTPVNVDKPAPNNYPAVKKDNNDPVLTAPAINNPGNVASNVDKPAAGNTPAATNVPAKQPVLQPADSAVARPAVDNPQKTQKKKQKRGFDGGITLGPDYNAVPSLKGGRIGFGGGLLLRYHINNNFYISTGAAYTKKLYGAEDKDYNTPYPTYYKKIDADCDVLDVPLNLHYTFLHRPQSRWSVMAGASSYFMLKEKYEYYTMSGGKYTREFSNSNRHYFSVLNLGVNYEKETRGRISWGLQPFVKLPVGGVGQGKVKLVSAGVSLQVTVGKK